MSCVPGAPAQGVNEQLACYLNAAALPLQLAIGQAAICEVFGRAEDRWFSETVKRIDVIPTQVYADAREACQTTQENQGSHANQACVRDFYRKRIEEAFRAAMPRKGGAILSGAGGRAAPNPNLAQCPRDAPDCVACDDVIECSAATPWTNAQLGALREAAAYLLAAEKNAHSGGSLLSSARELDYKNFAAPPPSTKGGGTVESGGSDLPPGARPPGEDAPARRASPAPSPSPSPSPSPLIRP